jgi:ribosomal protein S18 acetylase RimI-like enzyme
VVSGVPSISIRLATKRDAKFLPDIERSAGAAFLSIPELAWIASDDVQSEEQHLALIENGGAWVAANARDAPVGFLNGERRGGAFHILEISISSQLQGRGLGRLLIARKRRHGPTRLDCPTSH